MSSGVNHPKHQTWQKEGCGVNTVCSCSSYEGRWLLSLPTHSIGAHGSKIGCWAIYSQNKHKDSKKWRKWRHWAISTHVLRQWLKQLGVSNQGVRDSPRAKVENERRIVQKSTRIRSLVLSDWSQQPCSVAGSTSSDPVTKWVYWLNRLVAFSLLAQLACQRAAEQTRCTTLVAASSSFYSSYLP